MLGDMTEWSVNTRKSVKNINVRRRYGSPDLVILFTNTVSHKMARCAVVEAERANANIIRCHTSSQAALNEILDKAAAV